MPQWIWQHPGWPNFTWQDAQLGPVLRQALLAQGELLGKAKGAGNALQAFFSLDAMLQNIIYSSPAALKAKSSMPNRSAPAIPTVVQ